MTSYLTTKQSKGTERGRGGQGRGWHSEESRKRKMDGWFITPALPAEPSMGPKIALTCFCSTSIALPRCSSAASTCFFSCSAICSSNRVAFTVTIKNVSIFHMISLFVYRNVVGMKVVTDILLARFLLFHRLQWKQ